MPDESKKCYLCGTQGKFEKLFRNCNHESACYNCLRCRYVDRAQREEEEPGNCGSLYPLKCYHPECSLLLRDAQMKRLVRSKHELQDYHELTAKASAKKQALIQKTNAKKRVEIQEATRFGPHWRALAGALQEEEVCRCPKCKMFIIKAGGCSHMTCYCGVEFYWTEPRQEIAVSCRLNEIEEKYNHLNQFYSGMVAPTKRQPSRKQSKKRRAPLLQMDDDDEDYVSGEDFSVSDESPAEIEIAEDCSTSSVNPIISDFSSLPSDFDNSFPSLSLVDASAVVEDSQTNDCCEQGDDFQVLELPSDASDDSWTQFESDGDFQTSTGSQMTTTPWEEVSEVSSVVSFNSKTGMSFLEAARAKASSSKPDSNGRSWKEVSKVPRPMSQLLYTIVEDRKPMSLRDCNSKDEDQVIFDADFMLDGAKCSRGGKQKFKTKRVQ